MTNNFKDLPTPQFAGAYSTDKRMATGQTCLALPNGTISYSEGGKSSISLSNSQSFLEIQADIVGNLAISIDLLIASLHAGGLFLLEAKGDLYSQSYYFSQTMTFPTQIYNPIAFGTEALNEVGIDAYNAGSLIFRLVCGDQFVCQINYGAGLYIAYQLDFVSWEAKVDFLVELHFRDLLDIDDITSLSLLIALIINTTGLEGIVTLLAYQQGGDYTELTNIFDEDLGGFFATACAFSNLTRCEFAVNQTLDYAVNNFPNQINMTDNGTYIGNIVPTSFAYASYPMIGIGATPTALTPSILEARSTLLSIFNSLQDQNSTVSHLLSSWVVPYMTEDAAGYLKGMQTNITNNIAMLVDNDTGFMTCYTELQNCTTNAQNLLNNLNYVDSNFIEGFTSAVQLQYVYCGGINIGDISGTAIPLGNNNYIKIQASKYKEMMQISFNDDSITIIEPNIGNNIGFKMALLLQEEGAYYGNTFFNSDCLVHCYGVIIDNPI